MAGVSSEAKAEQFLNWCVNEMHYRPRGRHVNSPLPANDDVKQLFRGQASDIVDFLINNVRSKQTVKTVKGNLILKNTSSAGEILVGSCSEGEYADLINQHSKLIQDLQAKRSAKSHLEKDLHRLKTDLLTADEGCQQVADRLSDHRRKAAMLQARSQQLLSSLKLLEEFRNRINEKATQFSNNAKKISSTQLYSKHVHDTTANGSQNLETACTKSLRESCSDIESFLHHLIQGAFSDSADTLAARKETLWNMVDRVFAAYPPGQIVLSLGVYAQDSAVALRNQTASVDVRKDAERLRFKYEAGGHLKDTSVAPSALGTVSALLEEAHRASIARFMEAEKSTNSAWRLSGRCEQAKEPVLAALGRSYRGQPSALQLATTLLEKETQVAVSRANLRHLHHITEELKDRISRAIREKEILYSKYQKIQDFTKIVDQKQNLIRVLVKQNLNGRSKLQEQRHRIIEYTQKAMTMHEPEARSHAAHLTDSVAAETEVFASLSLPYLMFITLVETAKIAVVDLSVNAASSPVAKAVSCETLRDIRELLECPAFRTSECLTQRIWKLKTEVVEIEAALSRDGAAWQAQQAPLIARVDVVCKDVNSHEHAQLQELLPLLHKRATLVTQALTDCLNLKDAVSYWWDQPAQGITPWVKVEDLTFQQWRDKWTVLVTRLRQMQIQ